MSNYLPSQKVVRGINKPYFESNADLNSCLKKIEAGSMLRKFSIRKRPPEKRTLTVKLETRQLLWMKNFTLEGTIDIAEIKEIRPGKNSKDFEQNLGEVRKIDSNVCFTILYGDEFNLKILSLAAMSPSEREVWMKGLSYLIIDTLTSPYPMQINWWLEKEFNKIAKKNVVNLKTAKSWLQTVNLKAISLQKLKELFQDDDNRRKGDLNFDQFVQLYYSLMFHSQKPVYSFVETYSSDKSRFTAKDIRKFLVEEQKEMWAKDLKAVKQFMINYLGDKRRKDGSVYFSKKEMLAYLFSKENSIWDEKYDSIPDGMLDLPMSHYWISSSHNTYLTGDQLKSDSSCEAYARVLRMGCRCIELDCWDGQDNNPIIYHGKTLTSKIKFLDVLKTIRDHAFVVSDLPLILSIEDHCHIAQQRVMASMFIETFGDMIVQQQVGKDSTTLPSPNQLKRKIIIKHKKLSDLNRQTEDFIDPKVKDTVMDISNSLHNGMMYLEDRTFREWNLHYFVLNNNKLVYTRETNKPKDEDRTSVSSSGLADSQDAVDRSNLHLTQKWFHGNMSSAEAEAFIRTIPGVVDGSFLVRVSTRGIYAMSFMYNGKVNNCLIPTVDRDGEMMYYIVKDMEFDSVCSLVSYYQQFPLRNDRLGFHLLLTDPIPQRNPHENKEWFYKDMSREKAIHILLCIPRDGTFLVRSGLDKETNSIKFAISFIFEGVVKHCRVKLEEEQYVIGNAVFESLCDVVSFYEENTLYRKMKLSHPVTGKHIKDIEQNPSTYLAGFDTNEQVSYIAANSSEESTTVKALYDYRAGQSDELTFCRGDVINNVIKSDDGWWKGDLGLKIGAYFPSNYVEEVSDKPAMNDVFDEGNDGDILGEMQEGVVDLTNCTIELMAPSQTHTRKNTFRIRKPDGDVIHLSTSNKMEMVEWVTKLKTALDKKDFEKKESQKIKTVEQKKKIAVELSDLIYYCRSIPFQEDIKGQCYEMSSFHEPKAEHYSSSDKAALFIEYNSHQFSRVYPRGTRVDSSNYNPVALWNCGSQLCALNFQSGDLPMQLNEARFEMYNRCGFVLKPECMQDKDYHPYIKKKLKGVEPVILNIQILAARHLPKSGGGLTCPFVEVEIIGCEFDNGKVKTPKKDDNGLNPVWDSGLSDAESSFDFDINCPDTAFIKFTVYDQDMFGDPNFVAQATFPVPCVKTGLRSVPLKNCYSENIPLASLLVHLDVRPVKDEDADVYDSIQMLRNQTRELQSKMVGMTMNHADAAKYHDQLAETQRALFMQNQQRKERNVQRVKRAKGVL